MFQRATALLTAITILTVSAMAAIVGDKHVCTCPLCGLKHRPRVAK